MNSGYCQLSDVTFYLEIVLNLLVLLHGVGHVNKCLTEVHADDLLELPSHLKGRPANCTAQVQCPALADIALGCPVEYQVATLLWEF